MGENAAVIQPGVKSNLGSCKEALGGHLFASIEKFGSHLRNVTNYHLWLYKDLFVSLLHS